MKTHARPALAPGRSPRLARRRTSSGCIFRNCAAWMRVRVFIASPYTRQETRHVHGREGSRYASKHAHNGSLECLRASEYRESLTS
jgi:hypothetical protein